MQVILALSLYISLIYAVVQLEPIAFRREDWTAFVECLQNVTNNYDVTVQDGWMNVGPVDPRDPDFDGVDAILQRCLIAVSSRLSITGGYNVKSGQVQSVSTVTAEWLESQGAQSLEGIPIDGTASRSTLNDAGALDMDYNVSSRAICHDKPSFPA